MVHSLVLVLYGNIVKVFLPDTRIAISELILIYFFKVFCYSIHTFLNSQLLIIETLFKVHLWKLVDSFFRCGDYHAATVGSRNFRPKPRSKPDLKEISETQNQTDNYKIYITAPRPKLPDFIIVFRTQATLMKKFKKNNDSVFYF